MKPYQYATAGDGYQHLVKDGVVLCGATSEPWHAKATPGPFPGISLCTDCADERKRRVKAEELAAEASSLRTYWLRSKTP